MTNIETEVAIYAKISDPNGLNKADATEMHFQLEKNLNPKGRCRVRKTLRQGYESIDFTLKTPLSTGGNSFTRNEHTIAVDQDFMRSFQTVADYKFVKTRYTFISKAQKRISKLYENEYKLPPDWLPLDEYR